MVLYVRSTSFGQAASTAVRAWRRASSVQMHGKFAGLHWLLASSGKRTFWTQSVSPRMADGISGGVWGMAVTLRVTNKVEVRVLSMVGIVVMAVQGPVVVGGETVGRMLVVGVETD